jgi:hypothetical protein
MSDPNLIVARFMNGTVVKGSTQDFFPERPQFHVQVRGGAQTVAIKMSDLKAIFFVKDLVGNPGHVKNRKFGAIDPGMQSGKRIAVLFKDGELLVGYTVSYTAGRQGFFLIPVDPHGNNTRIYVVTSATKTVKVGPAADELALTAPKPKPKPRAA